jgi:hypothetical protein
MYPGIIIISGQGLARRCWIKAWTQALPMTLMGFPGQWGSQISDVLKNSSPQAIIYFLRIWQKKHGKGLILSSNLHALFLI